MALQEEYEYAAFRCAFCNTLNPAKKQRPIAPRLPSESWDAPGTPNKIREIGKSEDSSTSPSEKDSGEHHLKLHLFHFYWMFRLTGSDSDDTTESQIDENRKAASESPESTAPVLNGTETEAVETDTPEAESEKPNEEKKNDWKQILEDLSKRYCCVRPYFFSIYFF
jgi:endoplasmic reticulum junction formation protein lunapark